MPKLKTHRGAAKRFRITGTGKLKRKKPGHSHLLTGKSRQLKRQQRRPDYAHPADEKNLKQLLPYF
ncbi:MAG: 50S ribosomal protein L35 [Deltaproteobacteria bacterium]|nr:50S ribosomal protein L35 [Deltaproteobacteria bacterium]